MPPITVNHKPCWIVTHADGSPTGYEDEEARKVAANLQYENEPPPVVKQLDHVCAEATMVCGYRYDEDGEGIQHWPDSPAEFRDHLLNLDYRPGPDDTLLCSEENGCEECDGIAAGMPPRPAELPGQMAFGEVA